MRSQLVGLRRQLLGAEGAPVGLLPLLQQLISLPSQPEPTGDGGSRQFSTKRWARPAAFAGRVGGAGRRQQPAVAALIDDLEEPEPVLRLPELSNLASLNPRLHEIILQHSGQQTSAGATEAIQAALEAAQPEGAKRSQRPTKTALSRLRVDTLRGLLGELGGDSRGLKEVLVERLLELTSAEERQRAQAEQQAAAAAAQQQQQQQGEGVGSSSSGSHEGVVSRREQAAQQRVAHRLAAAASRGGSYGVPDASLRESHRQMVQQSAYSQIFTPQEVADVLLEARADDVTILDVRGRCPFTDWMVLASARSQRLAQMMAAAVLHALKKRARDVAPGVAPTIEGALDDSEWLVVDAGSVVAHVFQEGYRQEYALEELWGSPDGSNVQRVAPRAATLHTLDTLSAAA